MMQSGKRPPALLTHAEEMSRHFVAKSSVVSRNIRRCGPVVHKQENRDMARKPQTAPNIEYWFDLSPTVIEAYFSFHSPRDNSNNKHESRTDFKTMAFQALVASSDTPKLPLRVPVMIQLCETDEEDFDGGYLQFRKGKGELHIYIPKDYFFMVCNQVKNGTVKYIRALGNELSRGRAAIYDVAFSSQLEE